jgi:hypothetical protein
MHGPEVEFFLRREKGFHHPSYVRAGRGHRGTQREFAAPGVLTSRDVVEFAGRSAHAARDARATGGPCHIGFSLNSIAPCGFCPYAQTYILTGLHIETILALMVTAGEKCRRLPGAKIRNVRQFLVSILC